MIKLKAIFYGLTLIASLDAFACEYNTDCEIGSTCVKKQFELEGICMAGISPGNSNDRKPYNPEPYVQPKFKSSTVGNTCSYNMDCAIGESCMKESGSLEGVCMKKRY